MILIIDHNWLALSKTIKALEKEGMQVAMHNDYERAMKFIEGNHAQLSLAIIHTEIKAPRFGGLFNSIIGYQPKNWEGKDIFVIVAEKLRELRPDIPIVFLNHSTRACGQLI